MKLIFLDFDGVLNTCLYDPEKDDIRFNWPRDGKVNNTLAVNFINKLIKETGADVVVSSTWRYGMTIAELQEILENSGFTGVVVGKTPRMDKGCRGDEILEWMIRRDDVERYVIIDDDSDMLDIQMDNFVKCNGTFGFMIDEYCKALDILNK